MSSEHRARPAGARWAELLLRAGPVLHASLEYETTLENLARVVVPAMADWCVVDLLEEDGSLRRLVLAHADSAMEERARRFRERYPADEPPDGIAAVLREGRARVWSTVDDSMLRAVAGDERHLEALRRFELRSVIAAPMQARGRVVGVLTLVRTGASPAYDEHDLAVAEDLAGRCALAIDNARLYQQARGAERRKDESLGLLEVVFDQAPIGLAFWDLELRLVRVNDALAAMNGRPAAEHAGRRVEDVVSDLGDEVAGILQRVVASGEPIVNYPISGQTAAQPGRTRHWLASYYPVRRADGTLIGIGAVVEETTERHEAEQRLRDSELRYRALVETAPDAILGLDRRERIIAANPRAGELFACPAEELIGLPLRDVVPDARPPAHATALERRDRPLVSRRDELARRRDGTRFPVHISVTRSLPGPDRALTTAVISDITERKQLEAQLARQALHDPLTDLPNRRLLADRLEHALKMARRAGTCVAAAVLDLDDFKAINDSLGHDAGDTLLTALADRLRQVVRASDTIARLGGDEFVVVHEGLGSEEDAVAITERLHGAWKEPFTIGTRELFTSASTGIAVSDGSHDAATLLRHADAAMYRAKQRGRGNTELFDRDMGARILDRLALEADLNRALERNELDLAYQPIVDLATGEPVALEALLRWQHPERGAISPGEFIPIAEQTGLIRPIGEWVLHEACATVAVWRERHPRLAVAVNLSAHQISDGASDAVRAALQASGLDPAALWLEITESALIVDDERAREALGELKSFGVELALDDFGTGYSSLSYLHRFPIDALKIDRSFIADIEDDPDRLAITTAIVSMAQTLGIATVAEGIETEAQLSRLRALGCDQGQGFHIARPQSVEQATDYLADRLTST